MDAEELHQKLEQDRAELYAKGFEAGVQAERERIARHPTQDEMVALGFGPLFEDAYERGRQAATPVQIADTIISREQLEGILSSIEWAHDLLGAGQVEKDRVKSVRAALAVVTGKGASDECPDCGKSQEGGYGPNEELLCGNDFHDLFPDGDPGSGGQR